MNSLSHTLQVIPPNQQEVVLKRTFAAPRDLVFDAWRQPKHVAQWLPPGSRLLAAQNQFRTGGTIRYVWRDTQNTLHELRGTYLDIAAFTWIVFQAEWRTVGQPGQAIVAIALADGEDGTHCSVTIRCANKHDRDIVLAAGAEHIPAALDRLAADLDALAAPA